MLLTTPPRSHHQTNLARKKLVFVLVDGIGDVAIPELGGRTPLECADTPWMDRLAAGGINGLMDPVEPGLACGSDTAHMSILGYNPRRHYRGRGAFESMGAGLDMIPGDIAFKSNFATLDQATGIVVSRRADRNFEGLGPILCDALNGLKLPSFPDHSVAVKYATEHRCGVRVRGPGLTDTITGTDPLKDNKPLVKCTPTEQTPEALLTSKLINELSIAITAILTDHPVNAARLAAGKNLANCVLLRGCGSCIDVPSVHHLHGLTSFMIAPTCIIAGLGMTVGMDVLEVPGATGDYQTDLIAKGKAAVQALRDRERNYDFGFIHIKAVDDAGHDQNVKLKIHFLERVDAMIAFIATELIEDEKRGEVEHTLILTGDHSTPVLYGDHSSEPVPFATCRLSALFSESISRPYTDTVSVFTELAAARGVLGRFCGAEVMGIARRYMGIV